MRKLTEEQIKDFADYQVLNHMCICKLGFDTEMIETATSSVHCDVKNCFDCWCETLDFIRFMPKEEPDRTRSMKPEEIEERTNKYISQGRCPDDCGYVSADPCDCNCGDCWRNALKDAHILEAKS